MNKQQEPRLRFQGFAGAWEEKKIGEILSEVRRSIYLEDSEKYQLVTVKRRNEGVVSRGYLFGKDILVKNYSKLKTDDYLISKRQIIHGANGIVPSELDNAIVSNEYLVVVSNNDVRTEFLTLVSRTPSMYRKFLLSSYGVDIEKMVFNVEDWKSREITLPSLPEQTHLSLFFRRLDSQIAESRAVLEKSRQLKKAMLAKMFPANGEKIPKIRFKGFEGEWEEKSLGKLAEQIKSYPLSRNVETLENTGFKYIHYGDIHRGIADIIYSDKVLPNIQAGNFELLKRGDLIIADVSEDYEGVGAACVIDGPLKDKVVSGLHTIAIRPNQTSPLFLYYLLKTQEFKQYGRLVGTGTKVVGITASKFLSFQTHIPTVLEQTAIGNFFRQLDETIALQTAEVEKLNQLKKGLLAAMLV